MALQSVPVASAGIGVGLTPLGAAICGETFATHGLEIQRHVTEGAPNVGKEVMSGKIKFGHFAAHAAVRAVNDGDDMVVIAGGFNQEFLVGAPGVTDLSELEGQPVLSGRPRDLHHFYVEMTFRDIMKKPGEHFILEDANRFQALFDGKVKAATLSTPSAVRARQAGCKILVDYAPYDLSFGFGGVMVRRDLLTKEPELVDAYLCALMDGLKLYKADRAFGVKMHHTINEVPLEVAEETYDVAHKGYADVPDPATPGLKRIIDYWKEEGYLDQTFSIDDVVDSGPIRRVCGLE
jgi:ABC-type nitrate/sulfonate/bicarbonate transport system substrate-binding protein